MGGVFQAEDAAHVEVLRQDGWGGAGREDRSWEIGQEAAARVQADAES